MLSVKSRKFLRRRNPLESSIKVLTLWRAGDVFLGPRRTCEFFKDDPNELGFGGRRWGGGNGFGESFTDNELVTLDAMARISPHDPFRSKRKHEDDTSDDSSEDKITNENDSFFNVDGRMAFGRCVRGSPAFVVWILYASVVVALLGAAVFLSLGHTGAGGIVEYVYWAELPMWRYCLMFGLGLFVPLAAWCIVGGTLLVFTILLNRAKKSRSENPDDLAYLFTAVYLVEKMYSELTTLLVFFLWTMCFLSIFAVYPVDFNPWYMAYTYTSATLGTLTVWALGQVFTQYITHSITSDVNVRALGSKVRSVLRAEVAIWKITGISPFIFEESDEKLEDEDDFSPDDAIANEIVENGGSLSGQNKPENFDDTRAPSVLIRVNSASISPAIRKAERQRDLKRATQSAKELYAVMEDPFLTVDPRTATHLAKTLIRTTMSGKYITRRGRKILFDVDSTKTAQLLGCCVYLNLMKAAFVNRINRQVMGFYAPTRSNSTTEIFRLSSVDDGYFAAEDSFTAPGALLPPVINQPAAPKLLPVPLSSSHSGFGSMSPTIRAVFSKANMPSMPKFALLSRQPSDSKSSAASFGSPVDHNNDAAVKTRQLLKYKMFLRYSRDRWLKSRRVVVAGSNTPDERYTMHRLAQCAYPYLDLFTLSEYSPESITTATGDTWSRIGVLRGIPKRFIMKSDLKMSLKHMPSIPGVPDADIDKAWKFLDPENLGKVSLKRCKTAVANLLVDRNNLKTTLANTAQVVRKLRVVVSVGMNFFVFLCALAIFGLNVLQIWLGISSIVLAISFIYGNSLKNVLDSVVFLFAVHPFDVGDKLKMGPDSDVYFVKSISLMSTNLVRWDGASVRFLNSYLFSVSPLVNVRRSDNHEISLPIWIDAGACPPRAEFDKMVQELEYFLSRSPGAYNGQCSITTREFDQPLKIRIQVWFGLVYQDLDSARTNRDTHRVILFLIPLMRKRNVQISGVSQGVIDFSRTAKTVVKEDSGGGVAARPPMFLLPPGFGAIPAMTATDYPTTPGAGPVTGGVAKQTRII